MRGLADVGLRKRARFEIVVGETGGVVAGLPAIAGFQDLGDAAVEAGAAGGAQLRVEGLWTRAWPNR